MKVEELKDIPRLHHAYIISGSAERGSTEVAEMLERRGVEVKGNGDVLMLTLSELSVDDARMVSSFASLNSIGEHKYIILSFSRATGEAQNALLKILEEAPGNSIFFLCVDAAGHLLPTLRSRAVVVYASEAGIDKEETEEAREFLKESYEKRLARVERMGAYISKTQDRAPVRAFAAALIREAHQAHPGPKTLRDLLDAERYLRLQGSSVKSILGHLAVSLPKK